MLVYGLHMLTWAVALGNHLDYFLIITAWPNSTGLFGALQRLWRFEHRRRPA